MAAMKPITGWGSKLNGIGLACDAIGMTDIPVVSQLAEGTSCIISIATGDYIGAALSVGSMIPIAGKAAEAAKIARRTQKLADTTSSAVKEAKLLKLTEKKIDDIVSEGTKVSQSTTKAAKPVPKKPSQTTAKEVKKEAGMEIEEPNVNVLNEQSVSGKHFDSDEWLGINSKNIDLNKTNNIFNSGTIGNQKYINQQIRNIETSKASGFNPNGVMPKFGI